MFGRLGWLDWVERKAWIRKEGGVFVLCIEEKFSRMVHERKSLLFHTIRVVVRINLKKTKV
jgi:hypothetical protein